MVKLARDRPKVTREEGERGRGARGNFPCKGQATAQLPEWAGQCQASMGGKDRGIGT